MPIEQEVVTQDQPDETIFEFEKLLGVGADYTPEHILKCFEANYWVKKENDELDEIDPFIEAKNQLIQLLVSSQMKAQRYFEITSPFENTCIACRGTGELYKFKRKTVKVNCHICAGKKKIKVKCRKCKGTGRFQKRWKGGGGINVTCQTCKGKGEVYIKCVECRGKGKIPKVVPDHEIKSTTPCKHCEQLGFTSNIPKKVKPHKKKKEYRPSNPVLSANLAEKIKESITDTPQPESTPFLGEE